MKRHRRTPKSRQPEPQEQHVSKRRLLLVFSLFICGFSILIYRAFYLHLAPDQKLEKIVSRQYNRVVKEVEPRGNIYDVNGERLAISIPTYSLGIHPHLVKNSDKVAGELSRILKIPRNEIVKKVKSKNKFLWITRKMRPKQYEAIHALSLEGLKFIEESHRYYPNRELSSQILGAVGYDNEGLGGIEKFYDKYLQAQDPHRMATRDAKGRLYEDSFNSIKRSVNHLTLTIDKSIQYIVETELKRTSQKWKAKKGMAVVMNPNTGEVLAMASYPPFNPNSYGDYNFNKWRNLPVTDTFEPGSIFKAMVAAAALESKAVTSEDKFFCEDGELTIGKLDIHDAEKYGELSLRDIIRVSSNIGIYKVSRSIGKKYFYNVLRDFGFGENLGIDFPGEVRGILRSSDKWQEIDWANIAFGQGVSVTLLQIASAFSVIANGGLLWKPYLVKEVSRDSADSVLVNKPKLIRRVVREETATIMRELLNGVVQTGGTGAAAGVPGYEVAGKTGTAQKFDWEQHAYSNDKYVTSFVGFLPANNPEFVIAVSIDEPKGIVYGGTVAAPTFRRMASGIVQHLKIPPQHMKVPVIEVRNTPEIPKARLIAKVNQDGFTIPNLAGLTVREVLSLLDGQDITVAIEGSGVAVRQEPGPGQVIKNGDECRIYFKPRT
jgi:cell division protein FtsI (penicillin-binding protein 3)